MHHIFFTTFYEIINYLCYLFSQQYHNYTTKSFSCKKKKKKHLQNKNKYKRIYIELSFF